MRWVPSAPVPAPPSHRPHLDGLRTFAVYAVVLFHAGLASFDGGYLGVDVFFVLSGYLVTQTLLRDVDRHGGIRFRRFYARRVRRLLPASVVVLVATAIVYRSVAAPGQAEAAVRSFQASFLYVANWYFIRASTGYFGASVAESPLLHFWSLAVEEQFYLVWPILLAAVLALAGRARRARAVSVGVVGALAAGSLALALALQGAHPDRAYFGTDARAYQLLAGALLALAPRVAQRLGERSTRGAQVLGAVALVGLVLLATSWWGIGPIGRGVAATVLTLALIAALDSEAGGPIARALSLEPIAYLGRISYGTYLWHWPVIVVLVTVWAPSPPLLAGITAGVATGLAALSARLLEQPIRRSPFLDPRARAVVAAGLATSLVGALLVAPAILDRPADASRTVTASTLGFTPVPDDLHLDAVAAARFGRTVTCIHDEPSACTVVRGSGPHVLLMGDSNAQMLVPAFEAMARREDLTLSLEVTGGCPWQRGFYAMSTEIRERCVRHKEDAYRRVIPALEPDLVVLVNVGRSTKTASLAETAAATRRSLDELRAPGRTLVLVEPVVQGPIHPQPLRCLQRAEHLEDCRYVVDTDPSPVDRLYRTEARRRDDVEVANLDRLVCPYLPICDPVVDGRVVRFDYQHLATAYSRSLGDELDAYFRAADLLDR